jgi:hypothetical protein
MSTNNQPTFQDIDVCLRLYDMRREEVMRQSRDAMNRQFWPRTFEELIAVTNSMEHPLNAAFRQVSGYWEMAYSFGRHGIVHPEFLVENNGEGLFFFAKVAPFLEQFRSQGSPTAFQSAEWAATKTTVGKMRFGMTQERVKKFMEMKK